MRNCVDGELLEQAKHSLEEALEQDKQMRESGELQEIMSRAVLMTEAEESDLIPEDLLRSYVPIPNRFRRAEANFLLEASEEHRKAEEDGTLYERTRPRAGMRD